MRLRRCDELFFHFSLLFASTTHSAPRKRQKDRHRGEPIDANARHIQDSIGREQFFLMSHQLARSPACVRSSFIRWSFISVLVLFTKICHSACLGCKGWTILGAIGGTGGNGRRCRSQDLLTFLRTWDGHSALTSTAQDFFRPLDNRQVNAGRDKKNSEKVSTSTHEIHDSKDVSVPK